MPFSPIPPRRIAIIGAGVSGLGAAYALKDTADVTVFEKAARPGGHACTVDIDYLGNPISVDVGFIVCNDHNYRNIVPLFETLGAELVDSDMSFSVSDPKGFEWSSDPRGLFAWKRNAADPRFLSLLAEIIRFNSRARADNANGNVPDLSLGDYLDELNMSRRFREAYLLPMGAAIWSMSETDMLDYPARSFVSFFDNHRLMHADRPTWRTVRGGSRSYVTRIAHILGDRLRCGVDVTEVMPTIDGRVKLFMADGQTQTFDDVIMACHADQSHAMLSTACQSQRAALSAFSFSRNTVYLHRDASLMPRRKAAWASWNVLRGEDTQGVCVSYWMNRLQNINANCPLFVTLNPTQAPDPNLTFGEWQFEHPQFNAASLSAREALQSLQGRHHVWFAGAWLGDGFHEAGLKSGLAAALALGGQVPWEAHDIPHLQPAQHLNDLSFSEASEPARRTV